MTDEQERAAHDEAVRLLLEVRSNINSILLSKQGLHRYCKSAETLAYLTKTIYDGMANHMILERLSEDLSMDYADHLR